MRQGEFYIKRMHSKDWTSVARIYKEGIETGLATFEQEVPEWATWDNNHLDSCRWVGRIGEEIVGWAALSPVSSRCVYGGVAEVSVYVATNFRGRKIGEKLLKKLVIESEKEGFWTLQSGIFPENKASIKMHENAGFRKIGYRERIGELHGVWRDNLLMEKRSDKVGIESSMKDSIIVKQVKN